MDYCTEPIVPTEDSQVHMLSRRGQFVPSSFPDKNVDGSFLSITREREICRSLLEPRLRGATVKIPHSEKNSLPNRAHSTRCAGSYVAILEKRQCPAFDVRTRHCCFFPIKYSEGLALFEYPHATHRQCLSLQSGPFNLARPDGRQTTGSIRQR